MYGYRGNRTLDWVPAIDSGITEIGGEMQIGSGATAVLRLALSPEVLVAWRTLASPTRSAPRGGNPHRTRNESVALGRDDLTSGEGAGWRRLPD
jgi:hypothetical protein